MATRVENIITNARDILADTRGTRWTDGALIRLINKGQQDITKEAKLLMTSKIIPLVAGQSIYTMPDDLLLLRHVVYKDDRLEINSTEEMDNLATRGDLRRYAVNSTNTILTGQNDSYWRNTTTTGDIECAIFDYMENYQLRVYPIPTELPASSTIDITPIYGVVTGVTNDISGTTIYESVEAYGVVAGDDNNFLEVFYSKYPADITTVNDVPEISQTFDTALHHYVAGMALRQDTTTAKRDMADEELKLYDRELSTIMSMASKHNVTTKHFRTTYNGMG